MCFITKRITCVNILESYTCANVTCINALHRNFLVGVHLEQAADTLFLARTGIVNVRTGSYLTRVNAEEYQTTHIWISSNLKCECCGRFCFRWLSAFFLVGVGISTNNSLCIKRRRKECTSIIEQWLNTFILIRRTQSHWSQIHGDSSLTDSSDNLLL